VAVELHDKKSILDVFDESFVAIGLTCVGFPSEAD
jgi:hypothetical protein